MRDKDRKTRGLLLGVFDCIHRGHLNLLQRAAKLVDELTVAVVKDAAVKEQKGEDRPIYKLADRIAIIEEMSCVDRVVIAESFDLLPVVECYYTMGPDVLIVGQDQEHLQIDEALAAYPKTVLVRLDRTPGISTTEIIKKLRGQ